MIEIQNLIQNLNDEDKQLLAYKYYLEEAWKLAAAKHRGEEEEEEYKKRKPYSGYKENTQNIIERIAVGLFETIPLEEFSHDPFEPGTTIEEIKEFFASHESTKKALDSDADLHDFLVGMIVGDSIWARLANQSLKLSNILHQTALHYPFPPVDSVIPVLYSISYGFSIMARIQAQKLDPSIPNLSKFKSFNAIASFMGSLTLIGFGLTLATGPVAAVAAPILIALGTFSLAFSSVVSLGKKIGNLVREIKYHKHPEETYKLRVFRQGLICVKQLSNALFYVCLTALAVGAVVALFGNPFGLGILAGSIVTIAAVTLVVSIGTQVMNKLAERRIAKIEKEKGFISRDMGHRKSLSNNERKSLQRKTHFVMNNLSSKHGAAIDPDIAADAVVKTIDSGLQLMRHVEKHRSVIKSHAAVMTKHAFREFSKSTVHKINTKLQKDPLYQGISAALHQDKAKGHCSVVVHVPKDHSTGPDGRPGSVHDEIKRYQNQANVVEMTLSRDPSDRSIYIFLDMNRSLAPLKMDYCGNPQMALKIFEAAKLMNVTVILSARELDLLANSSDVHLKEYFHKIQEMSSEEFHRYMAKRQTAKLGEIPNSISSRNRLDK